MANEFQRISAILRDEGMPMTPQEISNWSGIPLMVVYRTLQENKAYFREIVVNDELVGWTVDFV